MARRVCIHYSGAGYHVMLRGNSGRDILFYESDGFVSTICWPENLLSLTEPCMRLDRDLCSLSQAVKRLRRQAETDPRLAAELERLKEDLAQKATMSSL